MLILSDLFWIFTKFVSYVLQGHQTSVVTSTWYLFTGYF